MFSTKSRTMTEKLFLFKYKYLVCFHFTSNIKCIVLRYFKIHKKSGCYSQQTVLLYSAISHLIPLFFFFSFSHSGEELHQLCLVPQVSFHRQVLADCQMVLIQKKNIYIRFKT